MSWISDLYTELAELVTTMATKLNTLNTNKEDKSNKQTNLSSTNANHYPNVPAVKQGLDDTLATAQVYTDSKIQAAAGNYIPISQKGANNGVAELDSSGRVPATQLPSYVDDVVDLVTFVTANPTSGMTAGQKRYNSTTKQIFTSTSATAGTSSTPESDKIYVRVDNNTTWRWSGTDMVQMNAGLALGETSSTAYRGDRGKIAYDHSQSTGNPHNTQIGQIPNLQSELDGKSPLGHTHAYATATVPGFVELGSDTVQTVAAINPTAVNNRTYPVQLNSAGQMVVNVAWTDNNTTYQAGSAANLNATTPDGTARVWAPNVIKPWADGRYVLLDEMGDPTVGIPDWSAALQTQTPNI